MYRASLILISCECVNWLWLLELISYSYNAGVSIGQSQGWILITKISYIATWVITYFLNQVHTGQRPVHAWFLGIHFVHDMCISLHMWHDMDPVWLVKQVLLHLYGNCSRYISRQDLTTEAHNYRNWPNKTKVAMYKSLL